MTNKRNIVVAVDFSPYSKNALLEAKRLARRRKATLYLVHVAGEPGLEEQLESLGADFAELRDGSVEKLRARLEQMLLEAGAKDLDWEIVVRPGAPHKELQKALEEINPGLLVLGSRGRGGAGQGASKLAIHCIRKAKAKVLIVRRAQAGPFTSVGAFVDFTKKSETLLQQATYIARTDRAKLHLFHVYLPPWRIPHYGSPSRAYSPEAREQHKQSIIRKMHKILEPFEKKDQDLQVDYHLVESSEKIIGIDEFIAEAGVDLVVISTRPRTGVWAVLLRTIAEHIIRTSPCSVLAVKN